jgi:signal peptidase I
LRAISSSFAGHFRSGNFPSIQRSGLSGQKRSKSVFREYFEAITIAILLALFIRTFVVQAFKIPSGSMLPTLLIGDHLLVNKFVYGVSMPFIGKTLLSFREPERGEVVVFRFPKDRSIDYIKRVVAVPGDTLQIRDKQLFINGEKIEDPHAYISAPTILPGAVSPRDNFGPVLVPEGRVFVMGDNRDNSYDSRFWGFVEQRDILGKAFILYWSWDIDENFFSIERFASIRWNRLANMID